MITKLTYDKNGNFDISGTIKVDSVDFENKNINIKEFFNLMIDIMLNLKRNILKQLSNDNKILGTERVEVVQAIDKFLTLLLAFALIISDNENNYSDQYKDHFEINIQINKTKFLTGNGKLYNISAKDIVNYDEWIDDRIINTFKRMITHFNKKGDRQALKDELIRLIYNSFALRYKVEYI